MKKIKVQSTFLLIISIQLFGCISSRLIVDTSQVKSTVFVKGAGESKFQNLGETPLNTNTKRVLELTDNNNVVIMVSKEGYMPRSIVVTDIDSSSDIKINFDLTTMENFLSGNDPNIAEGQREAISKIFQEQSTRTNKMIDQLFEAQRLIKVGRLEDAESLLKNLEENYPNVASIYEIQGGLSYIKKDYARALDAYRKAARFNPSNLEVINMKVFLEEKVTSTSKRSVSGVEE